MESKAKRLNTHLEAEGAEFLVLGNLLLQKITAFKAYVNHAGYDIIAVNEKKNTSARIQVKSRYQTGWSGFIIKNFNCDFVVLVALNRGFKKPDKNGELGIRDPEYYIFPVSFFDGIPEDKNNWGKIPKSKMIGFEDYKNRWDLIMDFLKK